MKESFVSTIDIRGQVSFFAVITKRLFFGLFIVFLFPYSET